MTNTELFIDNKYHTLYCKIVDRALLRDSVEGYTEKHHIIPKSMGGSNLTNNLVILTGREHFICHYLLTKFANDSVVDKMLFAFGMMSNSKKRYTNSRLYQKVKSKISKARSKQYKGKKVGTNHPKFNGFYITPFGMFDSSRSACRNSPHPIDPKTLIRWCNNSDGIISLKHYRKSPYLQSMDYVMIGMTFKDIGFYFIHI